MKHPRLEADMAGEKHGLESSLFHITKAASTSENTLKDTFERFCHTAVPRNPELRSALISCLENVTGVTALKPFTWYARETILPPLAEIWLQESSTRLQGDTITRSSIKFVHEDSLQMLKPGTMINDEIVEAYLELVRKSGIIICTTRLLSTPTSKKLHPIDRAIDYSYILQNGPVFVPIHDPDRLHWTFARIQADDRSLSIDHFDSCQIEERPEILLRWAQERFPGVTISFNVGHSPQQSNAYDCGLYMLIGVRLMAFGSIHLSEDDADRIIPSIRGRILSEILAGTLNPTAHHYDEFMGREEVDSFSDDTGSDIVEISSHQAKPSVILTQGLQADNHLSQTTDLPQQREPSSTALRPQSLGNTKSHVDAPGITLKLTEEEKPDLADRDLLERANKLSIQKRPKENAGSVQSYIRSFASAELMVSVLRASIASLKITTINRESESLASMWTYLDKTDKLSNRHSRIKFSYRFWSEYQKIDDRLSPNLAKRSRRQRIQSEMLSLLHHSDVEVYKKARTQAVRAKIWTELIGSAAPLLPPGSWMAAYGVVERTTVMEALLEEDRKTFIRGVLSRLKDPNDLALSNLCAADGIYCALMAGRLPQHRLAIERTTSLEVASFADIVSIEQIPGLMQLPV